MSVPNRFIEVGDDHSAASIQDRNPYDHSKYDLHLRIDPAQAKQIALQTMQGAVSLLKETGWHPEEAIDKVTTPGGVTIKGLNELDHADFTSAVIRSLKAGLK